MLSKVITTKLCLTIPFKISFCTLNKPESPNIPHAIIKNVNINVSFEDFSRLRLESPVFVDKSLFIKEIQGKMLITYPSRWGKSINLSMLKRFFAKLLNEDGSPNVEEQEYNLRLFKGHDYLPDLKIAKDKYFEENFGKYPVIYMRFTLFNYLPEKGLINAIVSAYKEHKYLLNSDKFDSYDKNSFSKIINEEEIKNPDQAINNLGQMLSKYHSIDPILLIDEYDKPISSAILQDDKTLLDNTCQVYNNFFDSTFKNSVAINKIVVTGILRLKGLISSNPFNSFDIYNNHESTKLLPFYGFTEDEVKSLLTKENINWDEDFLKKLSRQYNGYFYRNTKVFNPFSISKYLRDIKINRTDQNEPDINVFREYWTQTQPLGVLTNTTKNDKEFLVDFINLAEGGEIEVKLTDLDRSKLLPIIKMINDDNKWINDSVKATYYSYLLELGFLVRTDDSRLKIPNDEVKKLFVSSIGSMLLNNYYRDYKKQIHQTLALLDRCEESNVSSLTNNLKGFIEKQLISENSERIQILPIDRSDLPSAPAVYYNSNEAMFHMLLIKQLFYGGVSYLKDLNYNGRRFRPDLVLSLTNRYIVIVMNYKKSKESAMDDAENYVKEMGLNKERNVIAIGINVDAYQEISIKSKFINLKKK